MASEGHPHPPARRFRWALGGLAVLVTLALALLTWQLGLPTGGPPGPRGPAGASSASPSTSPVAPATVTETPTVILVPVPAVSPSPVAGGNSPRSSASPHATPHASVSASRSPSASPSPCVHQVITVCLPPSVAPRVRR